ncbi:aminotransferase class IV [Kitasatospora indigofera]|uniref:aminotransferase class IV n=1 Tax=Kitasatospora indigofera TaxID=67307 RepID=UPI0032441B92
MDEGYGEAWLVGQGGVIAEGSITNVGFVEGDTVVWPDAPVLQGIAMQVLGRELAAAWDQSLKIMGCPCWPASRGAGKPYGWSLVG